MDWVKDSKHFKELCRKHTDFLVLFFYAEFSTSAQRAMKEVKEFSRGNDGIPVCVIDVAKVKGIHKQFNVKNVPTVLSLEKGKVTKFIEGVQSARFYELAFSGIAPARGGPRPEKRPHRVLVYSGPGCPACGILKSYLRRHSVAFREVNIANDPREAEKLVRRSGQMAVPQTDIDGHLVVGFDQTKLNRLLGIQPERS